MPHFDRTITLGNILSIISMVVAMFAAWSDLNTKVAVISTAQAYEQGTALATVRQNDLAIARLEKKIDWILDLYIRQNDSTPNVPRNK